MPGLFHEWLTVLQTDCVAHPTLTFALALVGTGLMWAWCRYLSVRARRPHGAWRDRSTPL